MAALNPCKPFGASTRHRDVLQMGSVEELKNRTHLGGDGWGQGAGGGVLGSGERLERLGRRRLL
jgi:hypothetical protein